MKEVLLTLIIGGLGGALFLRLRAPAGAMVGAMLFTAIYSVGFGRAVMPLEVRFLTQVAAGAFIGAAVSYRDLLAVRRILVPGLLMVTLMISLDVGMGFLMSRWTGLDPATALMACAPGGLMDISLIAQDVGADASKVALLQLLRLMTVLSVLPLLFQGIHRRQKSSQGTREALPLAPTEQKKLKNLWALSHQEKANTGWTLLTAVLFGALGAYVRLPAGTLTFAMAGCALLQITTGRGRMPLPLRRLAQILAGTLIGVRMSYKDLLALREILLPAMMLLVGLILINLIVGYLLYRITSLDLLTSLISSVPGGVSDMALIAGDLGADPNKVAILQLFRYVFVVGAYPLLIVGLLA
ncbi:hypothetical protein ABB02_00724 [Clostridiaceae bacterium JG1575]|nr:hypothetical protein ABB02_00724 [Clostridiaceae bacterium JG1575]